jgi:hypothetical protein
MALAAVTVAYPVFSHYKNAASAEKSRETAQNGPSGSAVLPSKHPTAKPTQAPGTVSSNAPTVAPSKKFVPSMKPVPSNKTCIY